MIMTLRIIKLSIEIVCYLHIILFVYAATSKLLDFQNFQAQLGQSPLLSAFAGSISYIVLTTEFAIAFILAIPKVQLYGLFAAFSMMVMFTTYIFIMLNYSSFVPCSCGGILENLGWTEHLVFNIVFVFLGGGAVMLFDKSHSNAQSNYKTT